MSRSYAKHPAHKRICLTDLQVWRREYRLLKAGLRLKTVRARLRRLPMRDADWNALARMLKEARS